MRYDKPRIARALRNHSLRDTVEKEVRTGIGHDNERPREDR